MFKALSRLTTADVPEETSCISCYLSANEYFTFIFLAEVREPLDTVAGFLFYMVFFYHVTRKKLAVAQHRGYC